ncbi:ATP4, subunit B of the stator stalk of mitochondrial F1F0 ATP synthase [Pisolithus orientalis]|uniref:ATP4, subunit B of the stator stalk of mitochondrial F1F0 ATP synthase n=1 Tax=Pisolithus orientalis TaxID=936130 RepID=UPI0022245618|nr:ATP4, subunit B of the stator stalk of mitochondrial F1F0 ATP synthase [Pisolithus orientalis]KAI5986544.1 ATP4, subunit B of the stator stalk of mitochondrial F1F0 ATP synthase [Pisolithus orientalis]
MSTSNPSPECASEIINPLPSSPNLIAETDTAILKITNLLLSSPNLITKAGTAILGTGIPAMATSQEVGVVVAVAGTFILLAYIAKVNGHIECVKTALENSCAEHTQAVKDCINKTTLENLHAEHTQAVKDHINKTTLENLCAKHTQAVKVCIHSVKQIKDIILLTKGFFPVSKETAWLVCYEQQLKECEQVELAKTIIAGVTSNLRDKKMQEILADAVTELEHKSIVL